MKPADSEHSVKGQRKGLECLSFGLESSNSIFVEQPARPRSPGGFTSVFENLPNDVLLNIALLLPLEEVLKLTVVRLASSYAHITDVNHGL